MPFEIIKEGASRPRFIANRNLYLDRDKKRVLEEGDADARFVFVGEGGTIPDDDVAKYKLDDSYRLQSEEDQKVTQPVEEPAPEPEPEPAPKKGKASKSE